MKEPKMTKKGALDGILVVDLSRLLPGPYCSMILADHGARVIAIEDKRYQAEGLFLSTVNRNKEHMSLDLKTPEGKAVFFRLAEKADVVLEGFRPGVVARLGVDYEAVRRINPGIIYCSITGYGQTGPYRDRAGHDANYMSVAGVLDLIGEADRPPSIPGVQLADIAGGGMNAAIGVLLALHAREKTGQGQYIDISMTDGMAGLLAVPLFFRQLTGQIPGRADTMLSHRYACYNTYETADGRHISIGAVELRFWKVLCDHLGVPEYIPLQYDDARRKEIIGFMRKTFRGKTMAEWEREFGDLDICFGPVKRLDEAMQDPQLRSRDMFPELESAPGRKTDAIGIPVKLSGTPGTLRTPPVRFGQSTASVLTEFGYSGEEIEDLTRKGVI
ncbi:MAG: CaiB/BaiF CoA transferase family protein [Thermodesulfobacteriota bacterium]